MVSETRALLRYCGDGHLLSIGPTGTGKTACAVIPNALMHPGPLIALDLKGEICRATARRRREMGQRVHILDLHDAPSGNDALNPLDLALHTGHDPMSIARSFAAELVERHPEERDRFWTDWSENMITAGVAWLIDDCGTKDCRLSRLYDVLTDGDGDPTYAIAKMMDSKEIANDGARRIFAGYLSLPDRETRPSVLASTLTHLRLFDNETMRRVTDRTTIDLSALIRGEPMTIYIIVPPARLTALRPLLRTWVSGLLFALTGREHLPEHRTLFLCDEIAQLGRLESFVTASTLMRGYGLQLWSFWQSISQMEVYRSDARTLLDNAGVIQCFGARHYRMAQDFTSLVGGIKAGSIMAMEKDEQILLIEGNAPKIARRVRYFDAPEFAGMFDAGPLQRASPPFEESSPPYVR